MENLNLFEYNNDKIYSVSEFTGILKKFVEYTFYTVKLKGEISSLKTNYASGYYFDLKDEGSKISCIIFKRDISKVGFEIKDGLSVIIYGRMNIYEARGNYSIIVNEIEPFGYGGLYLLFEQLKERLEKEGLFDEARKKEIPFLPRTIGIVTSKSGAVLSDMLKIIYSRFKNARIIFANASVQGEKAPLEIKAAIESLNLYNKTVEKIDVMIIGRGGGSIEDLWAFNDEITARAIYNSEIPVISAVGHEPDITIADYVADRRASTPSNAAEIVIPVKSELLRQIKNLRDRMGLLRVIANKKTQLLNLKKRLALSSPVKLIQDIRLKIDDAVYKLNRNIGNRFNLLKNNIAYLNKRLILKNPYNIINQKRQTIEVLLKNINKTINNLLELKYRKRVESYVDLLNSYNPYNVLQRGYSIVFSDENRVIASISEINIGDNIKIKLSNGDLLAKVAEKIPAKN